MTKKKKIGFIITMVMILLLALVVVLYYFGATYPYYDSIKKDELAIPGLDTTFVPQGFAYDQQTSNYFISGYMSDGSASRIYFLTQDNASQAKYITINSNNTLHTGHMGGIAVYQDYVWFASDGYVYRVLKNDIIAATSAQSINIIDFFESGNGADSLTINNGKLFVGEFYRSGNYETKETHHIDITENETNRALAYCYTIDINQTYGVVSTIPDFGLSLPNQTQGFDFTSSGDIVVSTSYSIPDSKILIFKNVFSDIYKKQINLFVKDLPVYILSSKNLKKEIIAPAMSEELVIKDNRAYILYESACSKYRLVNRTRTRNVHSISLKN